MSFFDTKKLEFIIGEDKIKFVFVIILFVISSALEFVSLGLMVPFINYVFDLGQNGGGIFSKINSIINLDKLTLILVLITVFFIRYCLVLFINYKIPKIAYEHQKKIRFRIIKAYIMNFHFNSSSSDLIQLSTATLSIFTVQFLMSVMKVISNLIIILFILFFLLFFNPKGTFILLLFFIIFYVFYKFYFRKKFKLLGDSVIINNSNIIDISNEIFKGLQEIKIYKKSKFFLNKINIFGAELAKSEIFLRFLVPLPRIILEIIIVFSFLLIVLFLYMSESEIPILSFLVYGYAAIRILPPISEFITSINVCRSAKKSLSDIHFFLRKNKFNEKLISSNKQEFYKLECQNLRFKYQNSKKYLFENLNFKISKGDFFGIFGESGVGKSTLIKIILGVQKFDHGNLKFNNDEKKLSDIQNISGYLPQDNFIFKGSIRDNISLVDNCSKNEELKIWDSLKKVKLKDKIKLLPGKINFKLNENGSNLSGGQKQRISIARALYHDRQVLFLDESTSFLDSSNEKLIMKLLKENKNLTKILITHNKDLLKYCNKILFLNKKISKMVIKN